MKFAYVRQHDDTDCAAACMAMVCKHYNKETTITMLRDMMGTDLKGTNLAGLTKCAEQLGFITQAVRVDREAFLSEFTLPAIAHTLTKDGFLHFVVIYKITPKKIVVGDPAKEMRKIDIDEFFKEFTGNLLILAPTEKFEEGKLEKSSVIKRYISLMMPQKKLFIQAMVASLVLTAFGTVSSLFNSVIYDKAVPKRDEKILVMVLILSFIVSATSIMITFFKKWVLTRLSINIDKPLMLGYFRHIYDLPMKFFATRKTGDITTRFSDACTIKNILSGIALSLVMDVMMAIFSGIVLFKMNSGLFGIIILMTFVSVVLIYIFKQPYKRINMEQMQRSSAMNSEIIEGLRSIETIKGSAYEDKALKNLESEYEKAIKIDYKESMLSNIQSAIAGLISTVGNLALLYVGISQVINDKLTLGSFIAFTTLSAYFMNPVSNLVGLQLSIQEANLSMKRLSEIMDYKGEQGDGYSSGNNINLPKKIVTNLKFREIDEIRGDIEFKNITFRYGNRRPALTNVSITIPEGKKVAIVGASGSGKSTIAKLLLKYYEPEEGSITIDGHDIKDYDNRSIRKAISYTPQNIELFSKSIFENIRVSKPDADYEEVEKAAKLAGADEFIERLPLGYDTHLEEAGNGLSGGEKQRLAIARAFLKNSKLSIMDEGTSSLDFMTEKNIFKMIYENKKDQTMLIIAHRLSTIKDCDKIIVLDKGEVVEEGVHEELLSKKGRYYELWTMQQG
ncbi:peptidase domain-containing ABC transporter [Eubacterium ruminantium]|uniref:peptidase domain-containing ABC transporter n=1 Tax=Eubacterium ruminantium TaxID=42322 RepID=UPI00247A1712|nr:peptidase domain-containing ABC transporter [Eubacterium ruminantium]